MSISKLLADEMLILNMISKNGKLKSFTCILHLSINQMYRKYKSIKEYFFYPNPFQNTLEFTERNDRFEDRL